MSKNVQRGEKKHLELLKIKNVLKSCVGENSDSQEQR